MTILSRYWVLPARGLSRKSAALPHGNYVVKFISVHGTFNLSENNMELVVFFEKMLNIALHIENPYTETIYSLIYRDFHPCMILL